MSTCSTARQTISALGGQLADIPALDLAIQGCIEVEPAHFLDKPIYEAAAHMENCAECQAWSADWLDKLYPKRAQRRERVAKYSCTSMFDAVTMPDAATKFSFTLFGERMHAGASTMNMFLPAFAHGARRPCHMGPLSSSSRTA